MQLNAEQRIALALGSLIMRTEGLTDALAAKEKELAEANERLKKYEADETKKEPSGG